MPDAHMPDHVIEDLRRENARLLHENHELTSRVQACLDHAIQINLALVQAASENFELSKKLSGN